MNRLLMRIVGGARFGAMIVTTLVLVVTLLIACGDRRVSWQGRLLILALRGYGGWSAQQAHDLSRQRHAYDTFGKTLAAASDVPITRLTVAHCPAEWALPPYGPTDRAVLYLHGGGYNQGSLISHRALVTRIARASGIPVLNLEYRLASEHPFPAALDDAVAAYQWLLTQGFAPAHLVVAGDSAGGGVAVAMLVALRDGGIALPAGAALLSPWTDLSDPGGTWERDAPADPLLTPEGLHTMARDYLGDRNLTTPLASPIYADLRALPPLLVQVGDAEVIHANTGVFAARATTMGVEVQLESWPGMFHDWQMMAAYLPEGQRAINQVGTFIRQQTGHTRNRPKDVSQLVLSWRPWVFIYSVAAAWWRLSKFSLDAPDALSDLIPNLTC